VIECSISAQLNTMAVLVDCDNCQDAVTCLSIHTV